jgi:hypothetical protein
LQLTACEHAQISFSLAEHSGRTRAQWTFINPGLHLIKEQFFTR